MQDVEVVIRLLEMAEQQGGGQCTIADTDEGVVILDTESGETYRVELRKF